MILQLAKVLRARGHQTEVIAPEGGPDQAVSEYSEIRPLPLPKHLRNVVLAWRTLRVLLHHRRHADVFHTQQEHIQSVATLLAGRIAGIRTIATVHLASRPVGLAAMHRVVKALMCNLASQLVFVSKDTARAFGRPEGLVIHNGVERDDEGVPRKSRAELRAELGLTDAFLIAFAGRVTPSKGTLELLTAVARLVASSPPLRPILMTFGPIPEDERESYHATKRTLGIEANVIDMGPRRDWRVYLSACDVFVLPSHYEGLPFSLLEAMAEGIPVVASRVGGIPEAVEHGRTGYLVRAGDTGELERLLLYVRSHPEELRAIGEAAADSVRARFSASKMAGAYLQLYKRDTRA